MEVDIGDLISNASDELDQQMQMPREGWKAQKQIEPEDPFDSIGKYITLFFILSIITLIFLQQELLVMTLGRFIKLDKKLVVQMIQSILISLTGTFYVYYTI